MARTLGDAWIRVRPDMSSFPAETARGVGQAEQPVTSRMGTIAKRAGIALGAAGVLGAAAFAKGAVTLEAEFGKTMNQLQANLGAPQREMKKLGDLAMKMGADTTFSASDASEAMLEPAKGGLTAAAIKGGALESALTLAAAGGVSMSEAAETMGNTLNTFNLKAARSGEVSAALAGAANASSASISSVAQGLQQVGTVAADAGFTVQETTGAIAALANAGIAGSDAGTSLKTMFANLVPVGKEAYKAFKAYELVTYDANKAAKILASDGIKATGKSYEDTYKAIEKHLVQQGVAEKGTAALKDATEDYMQVTGVMRNAFLKSNGDYKSLGSIAGTLKEKLDGLSASERGTALAAMFGSDARRAATVLMNEGSKGLAKYVKATSDAEAAEKQAAAATKGTAGALEQMSGSVETAQLAWGKAQKPIITFGATVITHIANGAVPHIERMGKALRQGLAEVDTSSLRGMLKSLDFGTVAAGAGDLAESVRGIDWASVRNGVGTGVTDALSVFGVVIKFAANNLDTLAKALPYLAAGFVIYKTAQLAANVAMGLSVPLRLLEIAATRQQTVAIRGLAAAQTQGVVATTASNVATSTGTKITIRHRIATVASAVATRVATVATKAWTVAQRVLNLVLRANPIGIVITLLAAMAGAVVWAYRKSDEFKRVVDKAWATIKKSVSSAWNNVIKPALRALAEYVTGTLVPVIKRLWADVVKPTFSAIGKGIKWAWTNVVKPVFGALKDFLQDTLFPVIRFLWDRVVKPVFGGIGKTIKGVWTGVIKPAFNALKDGVGSVKTAFSNAIDAVGRIWDRLKGIVMAPVRFVIDTVINKGLIAGFNKISEKVNGPILDRLPVPGGSSAGRGGGTGSPAEDYYAADGGVLPGYTPGRDVHHFSSPTGGNLHLSGGEPIMRPEFGRAVGNGWVDRMNYAARNGGVAAVRKAMGKGVFHGAFASGGVFRPVAGGSTSGNLHGSPPAIDIAVPVGSVVAAVQAGRVASSYDIPGHEPRAPHGGLGYRSYGRVIEIMHSGFKTLSAHLSRRDVAAGAMVRAGQRIGLSGNTGYSYGPHIHFGSSGPNPNSFLSGGTGFSGGPGSPGSSGGGISLPGWAQDLLGSAIGSVEKMINGPLGALKDKFPGNAMAGLAAAFPSKLVSSVADFLQSKVTGMFGSGASGVGSVAGISGPVVSQVQQVAERYGWGSGAQWAALKDLVQRESSWNPNAANPDSAARGLFQKMTSVHGPVEPTAAGQAQWGLNYIKGRYGTPVGAINFHNANGHYRNGGVLPTFDMGGIARGKGFLPKATVHPERVLSTRQTDLHDRQTVALERMSTHRGSERMELTITNWEKGTGYVRRVAGREYDARAADRARFTAANRED